MSKVKKLGKRVKADPCPDGTELSYQSLTPTVKTRQNKVPARRPADQVLDVSVESVSGQYLKLEKRGKLEELLRLQNKRERLHRKLNEVKKRISNFSDRDWLLTFSGGVRSRGGDYSVVLNREAARLEKKKVELSKELATVEAGISDIDPLILGIPFPERGETRPAEPRPDLISADENPAVFVRDTLIRRAAQKGLSDEAICRHLDEKLGVRDHPPLGVPEQWVEDFQDDWKKKHDWDFYLAAYRDPRTKNRMQKMISKAKARL